MATDYDAPRKTDDDDTQSIEALKERVPEKSSSVDLEDADNLGDFGEGGHDLSDVELNVVVLPPQEHEFTCIECFLVKHRSQLAKQSKLGPVCTECNS